jgi:hypothetical protein
MNDKQLNEYIAILLDVPEPERIASHGEWAKAFDSAMAMWQDRHPGTRPPAFKKLGHPPSCFTGNIPPIYEGNL